MVGIDRRKANVQQSAVGLAEHRNKADVSERGRRTHLRNPKRASYDIKNEARKLTNLMDFGEYCRKNGLKGENVAEHVVFEGKTVMRRVMEYGVESVLGTKIQMFAEPLTDGKEKSTESEANAE